MTLHLAVDKYDDESHWHWTLYNENGSTLEEHTVAFDLTTREGRAFRDPAGHLRYYRPIGKPSQQLRDLGSWIGQTVFGRLQAKLLECADQGGGSIQLSAPPEAQPLLFYPFELARLAAESGREPLTFDEAGLRLIYRIAPPGATPAGTTWQDTRPKPSRPKDTGRDLRILAVFSLPVDVKPLNLRRERYKLEEFVRGLVAQGKAVTLRVIQYGATPEMLERALQEGDKWDVVQLSGHGLAGELVLENADGSEARVDTEMLAKLLRNTKTRLKLLLLDACYTAAGQHAAARIAVGLDAPGSNEREYERDLVPAAGATTETIAAVEQAKTPSLGQRLAEQLDCAVLANRYPVGDVFATDLTLALYDRLLALGQPLPDALRYSLERVLATPIPRPELSAATPVLMGPRAADLKLPPPQKTKKFSLPETGLGLEFPEQPEHFVGRLGPMLRASQALAPQSLKRAVLFSGMPGGGKTTCAVELAWRYDGLDRFQGFVWWAAPKNEQVEVGGLLAEALLAVERQLNEQELGLTTSVEEPARFKAFTLPRFKDLLRRQSILLVLDNLETLLTPQAGWRDPLWGDLIAALLAHDGSSRTVLTSRVPPLGLAQHSAVLAENVDALSFAESVLLGQELPGLSRLFDAGEDEKPAEARDTGAPSKSQALLTAALRAAQGHPKILDIIDKFAQAGTLPEVVRAAERDLVNDQGRLDAFLEAGSTHFGEETFGRALHLWTSAARTRLGGAARVLWDFLCAVEAEDRSLAILEGNFADVIARLPPLSQGALPAEALANLDELLLEIERTGLLAIKRPPEDQSQKPLAKASHCSIHPGVAQVGLQGIDPALRQAADQQLADYWSAAYRNALATEMQGGSGRIVEAARRGVRYLLRLTRYDEAALFLQAMIQRDNNPASLATALPLLRTIMPATEGKPKGSENACTLAFALIEANRLDEAEPMLRDLLSESVRQSDFRVASIAAGHLVNLLILRGKAAEALALSKDTSHYSAVAGLGPWTRMGDEGRQLKAVRAASGDKKVLPLVRQLLERMNELPPEPGENEITRPWLVREGVLLTGVVAALYTDQWRLALALNAEIARLEAERGATALDLARMRFLDYRPLLELKHYAKARSLLKDCRATYEHANARAELGVVFSAMAELEDETGHGGEAVRFEQVALRHKYAAGTPDDCTTSHNNLAKYLESLGGVTEVTVAHRLAAAVIAYQTRSGLLRHTRSGLAFALRSATAPAAPPTFAEVTARVEQDEGIRFAQLFERLPKRSKHGDAAVTAVWKMAVVSNNPGWQGIPRVAHGEMDKRSGATRERAIKIPGIAHGAVLTIPGVTHADAMKIPGVTHIVAWKQPRVTYAGVTKAPGVVYGQAIRIPSTTHEAHIHLLRKPRA